jgi:hypothetical protein
MTCIGVPLGDIDAGRRGPVRAGDARYCLASARRWPAIRLDAIPNSQGRALS